MKIAGITKELTGVRIPPHLFRDAAATTLARTSPEAARLVRPVLAHASLETAEHHYIHAQGNVPHDVELRGVKGGVALPEP